MDIIQYAHKKMDKPTGLIIGTNLGAASLGMSLADMNASASAQTEAILAFRERFTADFLLTAMDLSVEAQCFGSHVQFSKTHPPVVEGRLLQDIDQINALSVPAIGEERIPVFLDAVRLLKKEEKNKPVLGGVIGPLSLAGSLFGVTNMLELTIADKAAAIQLIEKCAQFIHAYLQGFKEAGADGVILSEPTAGLLSPRAMSKLSSPYVREMVGRWDDEAFHIVYHNCAAKPVHLGAVVETGAQFFNFGEPMELDAALEKMSDGQIISGNLDPARVFLAEDAGSVVDETRRLLDAFGDNDQFLPGSGCDLPYHTPFENVDAFYHTLRNA